MEGVVEVVARQAEQLLAQARVALERRRAGARRVDQRLDDGARDRVAVERGVERGLEVARLGEEPVALQRAVVDRGVGVRGRAVGAEVRGRGLAALGLVAVLLEQRGVVAGRQDDVAAVAEAQRRELDVGGAQLLVDRASARR